MESAKGDTGLARKERLQFMLSPEELKALDDFRFEYRMPSRAAAIRELLRNGITCAGAVKENSGVKPGDYGALKAPKKVRSKGRRN